MVNSLQGICINKKANIKASIPSALSNAARTLAMVQSTGFEPARMLLHSDLNATCLPIPPTTAARADLIKPARQIISSH